MYLERRTGTAKTSPRGREKKETKRGSYFYIVFSCFEYQLFLLFLEFYLDFLWFLCVIIKTCQDHIIIKTCQDQKNFTPAFGKFSFVVFNNYRQKYLSTRKSWTQISKLQLRPFDSWLLHNPRYFCRIQQTIFCFLSHLVCFVYDKIVTGNTKNHHFRLY